MSEKLDGLRCVWTGKELITRNGTVLKPPVFFTRVFPNSCLDGELYSGRRGYKRVVEVALNGTDFDWLDLAFWVFDAPLLNLQFAQRYNMLSQVIPALSSKFIRLVIHKTVKNTEHAKTELSFLEQQGKFTSIGAEGLVLRNPRSFYETKRGWAALKLKTYLECDAVVKKNSNGEWLDVEIDGRILRVTNVSQAVEVVKIGQKVQLKYSKKSNGSQLPHKPVATRIVSSL
jgi:DNA ligase-1